MFLLALLHQQLGTVNMQVDMPPAVNRKSGD
jgi:hypothetical protein